MKTKGDIHPFRQGSPAVSAQARSTQSMQVALEQTTSRQGTSDFLLLQASHGGPASHRMMKGFSM